MRAKQWIALLVIIIILAGGAYLLYQHSHPQMPGMMGQQKPVAGAQPVFAAVGTVTSGFPSALIIGSSPSTQSSYSTKYLNANQETLVYDTKDSVAVVYDAFTSYFKVNKYIILNSQQGKTTADLYATSADGDTSVSIVPNANGSEVTVSFLKK